MPSTQQQQASLAYLDEQSHSQQGANAAAVALVVAHYYLSADPANFAGSAASWLDRAVAAVVAGYRRSALIQVAYMKAIRLVAVPGATPIELPAMIAPNLEQIRESLIFTGIKSPAMGFAKIDATVRAAIEEPMIDGVLVDLNAIREQANLDRSEVMPNASTATTGAATRHVQNGGRIQGMEMVNKDKLATGYMRVTGADPCYFCAALASRGPVFKHADTFAASDARFIGPGQVKVHDSCVVPSTLVGGPAVEMGFRRWYEGEMVTLRTARGNELTVTPNHPILTDDGWVPAGLIYAGQDVFGGGSSQDRLLAVPDEQQEVARIADLFAALSMEFGATRRGVPVAAEEFHGDGTDSEVDIVVTDLFFSDGIETQLTEPSIESALPLTSAAGPSIDFSRLCDEHAMFGRLTRSPSGGISLGGDPLPLGQGRSDVTLEAGGSGASDLDPGDSEAISDCATTHAEGAGQGGFGFAIPVSLDDLLTGEGESSRAGASLRTKFNAPAGEFSSERGGAYMTQGHALRERLAGAIERDRVVEARQFSYSGHVYNLQTTEGWYLASGIIASNCGCGWRPYFSRGMSDWPLKSLEQFDAWHDATSGVRGDKMNAFRQAHEGRAPRKDVKTAVVA